MNVSEFHLVVYCNTQGVSSTQAMNVSDLLQGAQVQSALIFSPWQLPLLSDLSLPECVITLHIL